MFTSWPLRSGVSRTITLVAALTALLVTASVVGLSTLGTPVSTPDRTAPAASQPAPAPLSIYRVASEHPARRVAVIVQFAAGTSVRTQRSLVAVVGGTVTSGRSAAALLTVRLPAAAAEQLAGDPRVRLVSLAGSGHSG